MRSEVLELADTKCHQLQCLKIASGKAHPRYSLSYGVEITENTEIVYVCITVLIDFVC